MAPALTGSAQQGSDLTLNLGTWTNATNLAPTWQRCDTGGANCVTMQGVTGTKYHLAAADIGATVTVKVEATNSGGTTPVTTLPTATVTAAPAGSLLVEVGYAGNTVFPSGWYGTPGVNFVGTGPVCCTSNNLVGWDAGAIRITNPTAIPVTIGSISVGIGPASYSLWSNITVPANGTLVVTQNNQFNFDTSESAGFGCFPPVPEFPIVHVTIGGTTTDYVDSQQILNTGGTDTGVCSYYGNFIEEGHDWVRVS